MLDYDLIGHKAMDAMDAYVEANRSNLGPKLRIRLEFMAAVTENTGGDPPESIMVTLDFLLSVQSLVIKTSSKTFRS